MLVYLHFLYRFTVLLFYCFTVLLFYCFGFLLESGRTVESGGIPLVWIALGYGLREGILRETGILDG